jgi:glycosyltransferase involved in cell wall biosynthesis
VLDLAIYFEKQMKVNWVAKYKIKGIYTDGFPPSNSDFVGHPIAFIEEFCSNTDALVCGSIQIHEFYSKLFPTVFYANGLLDEKLFIIKKNIKKSNFIVGWTGNPKRDFKGYYSHVVKTVEMLKVKYPDIELKSRFSGPIETLPGFYEDVDLVLIASDADAGPSMFGEAALMGVPSVSTNIGWPSQVIQDGINGYIVEKNIERMVEKVEILYNDRSLLEQMSERIRTDFLEAFNKQDMIDRWKVLFTTVLNIKK